MCHRSDRERREASGQSNHEAPRVIARTYGMEKLTRISALGSFGSPKAKFGKNRQKYVTSVIDWPCLVRFVIEYRNITNCVTRLKF